MAKKKDWESKEKLLDKLNIVFRRGLSIKYWFYRIKWRLYPKFFKISKFPLHMDVEATNNCNLKCSMCLQRYITNPRGFMDFDLYKKIIDEGSKNGLASIKLNWRGEPLLHPRIGDMIKYAKSKGLIDVQFLSNATLLTKKKAEEILESKPDQVIFSFDGATKETYEKVRIGAKYKTTVTNIKRFLKMRKDMGLKKPIVRIQTVRMAETEDEIEDFIKMWSNIADYVAVCIYIDYNKEGQIKYNLTRLPCSQLWIRLSIGWDGTVVPCCQDFNYKLKLGNIKKIKITDIWFGKKLNSLRNLHKTRLLNQIEACKYCDVKETYDFSKVLER